MWLRSSYRRSVDLRDFPLRVAYCIFLKCFHACAHNTTPHTEILPHTNKFQITSPRMASQKKGLIFHVPSRPCVNHFVSSHSCPYQFNDFLRIRAQILDLILESREERLQFLSERRLRVGVLKCVGLTLSISHDLSFLRPVDDGSEMARLHYSNFP